MNIHVVRPGGDWYSRPDVTLVRDADLFCLPDDCTGAQAFRACCIRIEKAGKAIAPPFARRYFNSTADSILFYGTMPDGTLTPYLDRSTWVSRDFRPADSLDEALQARIIQALCRISLHLSLRIGDFLLFEQTPPTPLWRGDYIDTIAIL
ncbi:MAG: hypothetical protein IJP77_02655 [Bacteroidales bacterium]|nr:hypothetical protein [Bacteroidales bacterium]